MKKFDQLFLFLNENAAGVTQAQTVPRSQEYEYLVSQTQNKPKRATTQFFRGTEKDPEYIAAEN